MGVMGRGGVRDGGYADSTGASLVGGLGHQFIVDETADMLAGDFQAESRLVCDPALPNRP